MKTTSNSFRILISFTVIITLFILPGYAVASTPLFAPLRQSQLTPFLESPYFDTREVRSVFDHEYPIYGRETARLPDPDPEITGSIVHYDGSRRMDLNYTGHSGIDFGLTYERVLAAYGGQVTEADWDDPQHHDQGLGLYVAIDHPNGYRTLYGHLSAISVDARNGVDVPMGTVIGISGYSGNVAPPGLDGLHLHFEVRDGQKDDNVVDPYGWEGNDDSEVSADP